MYNSLQIRKLQRFFGLKPTGINDEQTKKLLKKSRCGVAGMLDSAMTSGTFSKFLFGKIMKNGAFFVFTACSESL